MGIYGQSIFEYGGTLDSVIESLDYIHEFDISSALETLKNNIKKALVTVIEKLQKLVNKCPNNRIKIMINKLLGKAKKLLSKTNNVKSKEDIDDIKKETENVKNSAEKVNNMINNPKEIKNIMCVDLLQARDIKNILNKDSDFMKGTHKGVVTKATTANFKGLGYKPLELEPDTKALLIAIIDDDAIPSNVYYLEYVDIDSNLEAHLIEEDWFLVFNK